MFLRVYDAQGALKNTSANFTDAEIKTKYEANADTNEFSDAEKTKLGIAATAGGVFHNGFSDFVPDEHLNWPAAPAGKNVKFASGQGLDFSATADATGMTSELFDDYEGGDWTGTLGFSSSGDLAVTYSAQSGKYTKTGQDVTISIQLQLATFTHSTASGSLQINGLPFVVGGGSAIASTSYFWGYTNASYPSVGFSWALGASRLVGYKSGSAQVPTTITAADMPSGGTPRFWIHLTYQV